MAKQSKACPPKAEKVANKAQQAQNT